MVLIRVGLRGKLETLRIFITLLQNGAKEWLIEEGSAIKEVFLSF